MSERRHAHRVQVSLTVRYISDDVALSGVVSSLSRTGMFLRSDYLDSRGQSVAIAVTLPGEAAPLELAGEVVRVVEDPRRAGMGIRFTAVPSDTRRKLANFMIERSYQALA